MNAGSGLTRAELRQTYAQAWRKHQAGLPLTALEAMVADVIALHPQFQELLADPDRVADFTSDPHPDKNPFLHMGLHLAVRDQLAIDRPPGVRDLHRALLRRGADPHAAEHELMHALGETLWEAQQSGRPPDEQRYLERARRRIGP